MLPYRYTAEDSLKDAADCAKRLGVRYDVVPIAPAVEGFETPAANRCSPGCRATSTEENIQSRTRGTALMAVSNKLGLMLVTTGNKSEVSVGYATLYGDMNGGFNPIKDLYKTEVFSAGALPQRRAPAGLPGAGRRDHPGISIIEKPPTAELSENQKDQDSLPPYDVLDAILECLVEKEMRRQGDRGARLRPRHRQARRAPSLPRRIQAPAGGAGRQDHAARILAATAATRSPTASATRADRRARAARPTCRKL